MQVSKWGNSLAIRLPASVVEALELHEGDEIEVVIADERVFQVKKKPGNDAFLMRLREFGGSSLLISSLTGSSKCPFLKRLLTAIFCCTFYPLMLTRPIGPRKLCGQAG